MPKLTLHLLIDEKNALFKLAETEKRQPRQQASLIIRDELQRLGYLLVKGGNHDTSTK